MKHAHYVPLKRGRYYYRPEDRTVYICEQCDVHGQICLRDVLSDQPNIYPDPKGPTTFGRELTPGEASDLKMALSCSVPPISPHEFPIVPINIGQRWLTRRGRTVTIKSIEDHRVKASDGYTRNLLGRCYQAPHEHDLCAPLFLPLHGPPGLN